MKSSTNSFLMANSHRTLFLSVTTSNTKRTFNPIREIRYLLDENVNLTIHPIELFRDENKIEDFINN